MADYFHRNQMRSKGEYSVSARRIWNAIFTHSVGKGWDALTTTDKSNFERTVMQRVPKALKYWEHRYIPVYSNPKKRSGLGGVLNRIRKLKEN